MDFLFSIFELVAGNLELIVDFGQSVGGQPEVFLRSPDFVSHRGVLGHELLNLQLVGLRLLIVDADSVLVIVEFAVELGDLVRRQSQVFLCSPHVLA